MSKDTSSWLLEGNISQLCYSVVGEENAAGLGGARKGTCRQTDSAGLEPVPLTIMPPTRSSISTVSPPAQ